MVNEGRIALSAGAKENFTRPAVDPLFRSAAIEFGPRAIAVAVTGDLDDGASGAAVIHACGGTVIVQEPNDSVAPSMPLSTLRTVPTSRVARLELIGNEIMQALSAPLRETIVRTSKDLIATEARIALTGITCPEELDSIGERSSVTCPGCGGVIWRIGNDAPLRYRCHTGNLERSARRCAKIGFRGCAVDNRASGGRLRHNRIEPSFTRFIGRRYGGRRHRTARAGEISAP
jgi:two-component system chemotaxis response regulator CheB